MRTFVVCVRTQSMSVGEIFQFYCVEILGYSIVTPAFGFKNKFNFACLKSSGIPLFVSSVYEHGKLVCSEMSAVRFVRIHCSLKL